jgi:hypothetical protein
MSITDELRVFAKRWPCTDYIHKDMLAIADRIDAEHERAVRYERCAFWHDASDDELAKYGLLRAPIDADGEVWHIGDRTESGQTIEAMGLNKYGWHFVGTVNEIDPAIHRHYHAPTVEDVLREMCLEIDRRCERGSIDYDKLFAEYAAKLQLKEDA